MFMYNIDYGVRLSFEVKLSIMGAEKLSHRRRKTMDNKIRGRNWICNNSKIHTDIIRAYWKF